MSKPRRVHAATQVMQALPLRRKLGPSRQGHAHLPQSQGLSKGSGSFAAFPLSKQPRMWRRLQPEPEVSVGHTGGTPRSCKWPRSSCPARVVGRRHRMALAILQTAWLACSCCKRMTPNASGRTECLKRCASTLPRLSETMSERRRWCELQRPHRASTKAHRSQRKMQPNGPLWCCLRFHLGQAPDHGVPPDPGHEHRSKQPRPVVWLDSQPLRVEKEPSCPRLELGVFEARKTPNKATTEKKQERCDIRASSSSQRPSQSCASMMLSRWDAGQV